VTKVTLDSNIYVSALQFGGIGIRLIAMARRRIIRIDISEVIAAETIGVLRDKFGWGGYELHFARLELLKFANVVMPTNAIRVSDDPDDDRILECAVAAGSHFVVTEDKDLLRLGAYEGIAIVRAAEFLRRELMKIP
jgi:putative PIN family toxin of toxin-antitoxin system